MKLIGSRNKKTHSSLSFSKIGGKTKEVAKRSSSFFLYPKLIAFLLVTMFTFLLVRVYFSNQLAVSGGFVSVNSSRVETLKKENYQLENKISQMSSLSYVDSQAARLGLIKITKIEVLKGDLGVALKQ